MRKLKNRTVTFISDCVLFVILIGVSLVGFIPDSISATSLNQANSAIYRGQAENGGVSLMFNVYEGADTVRGILEVLDEREAKATFFMGGCFADDNQTLLNEILQHGHELANHGYFHKDHKKLSYEQNYKEIAHTNRIISSLTGVSPTLFAPPSGSFGVATLKASYELGLKVIMWSKDTIDWRDSDKQLIFKRATKGVSAGELILMHPKPHTLEVLPEILDYFIAQNLKTLTVTENITLKG